MAEFKDSLRGKVAISNCIRISLTKAVLKSIPYQKKGFYATYLKDYLQFFDSDQIHICFYEDLCRDPQSLLKNIFQFLGVDDGFQCNTSKIFNSAKDAKISTKNNLQNFIKTLFKTTHSSITDPINPNIQKKLMKSGRESNRLAALLSFLFEINSSNF